MTLKTYRIPVTRDVTESAVLFVQARNMAEAQETALDEAHATTDVVWGIDDCEPGRPYLPDPDDCEELSDDLYVIAWSYDWYDNMTSVRGFAAVVDWLAENFEVGVTPKTRPFSVEDARWKPFKEAVDETYEADKWKALVIGRIDEEGELQVVC